MNIQALIVVQMPESTLPEEKLGTFDMSAVPDVGDAVEVKDVEYIVTGRRWILGKLSSRITLTVRKR